MSMTAVAAARTPYYVLRDGDHPIGPKVVRLDSEIQCIPIYGFSDKGSYDKFLRNSELLLKPYPLVKGNLQNQVNAPGTGLRLVVLNAAEPHETCLHAATMAAVLEAQVNKTTHVTTAHRLLFDHEANAYRVEEASV